MCFTSNVQTDVFLSATISADDELPDKGSLQEEETQALPSPKSLDESSDNQLNVSQNSANEVSSTGASAGSANKKICSPERESKPSTAKKTKKVFCNCIL